MKPAPFAYHAPSSLQDCLQLLSSLPNARALAGGQSMMPMMNFRLAAPDNLVDINGVASLSGIEVDQEEIVFGAMTRQRDIEFSELVRQRLPILHQAVGFIGHRQTRNRGTIGGSLCHLDPSAELPTIATAMDAMIVLESVRGKRVLPMAEFALDLMTTAQEPDELLTEVRLRPWPAGHGYEFTEFARRHGDFAVVSVACLLCVDGLGNIERASLTFGGMTTTPSRLFSVEKAIVGRPATCDATREIESAIANLDVLEDPTYPASYRRRVALGLAKRALANAARRALSKEH